MTIAFIAASYLVLHLSLYAFFLRDRPLFKRESGIAALHLISCGAVLFALVPLVLVRGDRLGIATILLAAGLHGIYSLSFLELWALSHRSYSLSILDRIYADGGASTLAALAAFGNSGSIKRAVRIDSLRRLGLVSDHGGFTLTARGLFCATILKGVRWLSNGSSIN
jgi:hypothetical protein